MTTSSPRYRCLFIPRRKSLFAILFFVILAAVVPVPFYAVHSSSLPAEVSPIENRAWSPDSSKLAIGYRSLRSVLYPSAETIATFAADCVTPKSAFTLGETVCAQTDNVDLLFPGGRWVNWLRPNLSVAHGGSGSTDITVNPQTFTFIPDTLGTWKVTIAETGDPSQTPAIFTVGQAAPIATYAADCTTPKTLFTLGDVVCARTTGIDPAFNRRFAWVDPAGLTRRFDPITTDPDSNSYTLPATDTTVIDVFVVDNRGTWKVNVVSSRGSQIVSAPFQVQGATPRADLSIGKTVTSLEVDAGNSFTYNISVTNFGPNPAQNVVLTDPAPPDTSVVNATFVSSSQTSGPAFTCTGSAPLVCTRGTTMAPAFLNPGESAVFALTYTATGVPGSSISNTAKATSDTVDLNEVDNTTNSSRISISDNGGTPPTCSLECPNSITVAATSPSGAVVTFPAPDEFGDCGTALNYNHASGSVFPIGTTTVSVTSGTGGGSCSFTVTVINAPDPTISCPPDKVVAAPAGALETNVTTGSPTAGPTGAGLTLTISGVRDDQQPTSDPYPVGETFITWTATDQFDRVATCFQKITVTSPDAPTITCPGDKTFNTASCSFTASPTDIGSPIAGGIGVTVSSRRSDNLGLTDPYPAGLTVITWTATDSIGRVASCTQNITVHSTSDTTPPTLTVPPDISVTTTNCSEVLDDELGVATASDDCSTVSITRVGVPLVSCPVPGNPTRMCETFVFPTGTTTITYTATDGSGNVTTGVQHVTVLENIPPTITGPADVTLYTGVGASFCGVNVSNLDLTLGTANANDNCPGVTVTRSGVPAGNNFPVGDTTVTYTATDRSNNTATTTQKVTVVDNTAPTVTPPPAITLYTGAGATSCGVTVSNLDATLGTGSATDNCPGVSAVTRSGVPAGNVFPVGQTTITYSATDAALPTHNTGSATQIVTVVDNTPPVITLNGQTPSMWPPNHKYQTFQVTNFVTAVTDNCGSVSVSDVFITKVTSDELENSAGDGNTLNDIVIAGDCKSIQLRSERDGGGNGRVYTIFFKVVDSHGNVGTATAKVVVNHNPGQTAVDSGAHYTVLSSCP